MPFLGIVADEVIHRAGEFIGAGDQQLRFDLRLSHLYLICPSISPFHIRNLTGS
jgi:hypothetical protein